MKIDCIMLFSLHIKVFSLHYKAVGRSTIMLGVLKVNFSSFKSFDLIFLDMKAKK